MTASPSSPETVRPLGETLDKRQKWALLISLMISLFIGALDQTVVSTATPKILADLGGFNLLSWLFTSYMLSSTVVIPLVGKLGDIFGRKFFLLSGIVIFMIASAACGAAPTMTALILFRVVQGIGGGMLFASVFATIGDIFPPSERAKYMGLFTGTFSLASILGPTLGGFLTDHGGWRWVFFLNIPVGFIAIPAIWFNLPSRKATQRPKLDFLGAALLSASSVAALFALVWAGHKYDWGSPQIVGLLAGSVVFLALFIAQERRHPEPILPLHLFKNRVFLMSNLIVFAFGAGVFGAFQFLGLFVQVALDASATSSGVITTPQSAGVLLTSIIGGQIISRVGKYKRQTIVGSALIATAMVGLTTIDLGTRLWEISAVMVVLGLGFGLVLPTMSLIVQNAVPYQYLGVASSSSQFFRQMGSVLGIAIFGSILANSYHSDFNDRFSPADRAAVGTTVAGQLDDPTGKLNKRQFAAIEQKVSALPDGAAILGRAKSAQAEAIATATRHIFYGALAAAVVCFVLCVFMKELPLRRTMGAGAPAGTGPQPESVPAAAGGH